MAFPIVKMGNKTPHNLPFPLDDVDPHLNSNTAVPRPTARITPNRSSDGWGTVAHVRSNVSIEYSGAPQIRLQKYPFPWTDPKPHHLPHPCTRPTYDAKRHPDPIRRFLQCTGQTDRSFTGKFDDYSPLRL